MHHMRWATILLMAVIPCASAINAGESLELTPERTFIVNHAPADESARITAELLQRELRKASQTEKGFPIVSVPPQEGIRIRLNDPELPLPENLDEDGFVIKRSGSDIRIRGVANNAILFGAVEFLRQVGVTFYMPGDLFTARPSDPRLKVGDLDIVTTPFAQSVFFSGIMDSEGRQWAKRNAVGRRKGGTHQHNSFAIFPPEKFRKTHPEVYPIIEGKRFIPVNAKDQSWQPNFIEPFAVDAALESIEAYFKENPSHRYIAVSIQDGHGFDQGPKTRAVIERFKNSGLDSPVDRATSEIYWRFVTRLAKRLKKVAPGKMLVALAYAGTRFPPADPLPENVMVITNFHIAEYGTYLAGKEDDEAAPEKWLKVCRHLGNHDWYQGSGFLMPRSYSGYWSRYLKGLASKTSDTFMHVETYPNWGFDGPKLYILSRLLWDPSLDPAEISKKMCRDLFGNAAGPMIEYFAILEKLWDQLDCVEGPERKLYAWTRAYVTTPKSRALITAARTQLDEASKRASGEKEKARVELFSDCFSISEALFRLAGPEGPEAAKSVEETVHSAEAILQKHGSLAVTHPDVVAPAIRELADFAKRADADIYDPTVISQRATPIPPEDPLWQTVPEVRFSLPTGGEDPQKTTLRLARDAESLYFLVRSPFLRDRKPLLDDSGTWRSDNIEFKFDTNGDWGGIEGQFWVKPTGRLVDWSGREDSGTTPVAAVVRKTDTEYLVSCRVPLAYLKMAARASSPIGVQVFRNEFQEIPGMNQQDYSSVWSAKIRSQ